MKNSNHVDDLLVFLEEKYMRSDQYFAVICSHEVSRMAQLCAISEPYDRVLDHPNVSLCLTFAPIFDRVVPDLVEIDLGRRR